MAAQLVMEAWMMPRTKVATIGSLDRLLAQLTAESQIQVSDKLKIKRQ